MSRLLVRWHDSDIDSHMYVAGSLAAIVCPLGDGSYRPMIVWGRDDEMCELAGIRKTRKGAKRLAQREYAKHLQRLIDEIGLQGV